MTIVHDFTPLGACRDLINSRDPEILLAGPAGTGKSRACLEKLNTMALANPGMRGLIVRKSQTSLASSALVTWNRDVIPDLEGVVEFYGGSAEQPAQYRYRNGSVIVIGGLDKTSKIMSSEYDLVYVQEAVELTEDDWEALTSRLRSDVVSFQQLMADTNPAQDTHWLKQRCDRGQTLMLYSQHEDNPLLWDDGWTEAGVKYIARLDSLTGVRHQRLRLGLWVSAEGLIYDEWNPAIHLVDRFPIPAGWPRYWAVDFGYTNPFVCQWWAQDPNDRLYLYRELYQTQRTVDQHAQQILAAVSTDGKWDEPKPRAVYCDHDAEGRAQLHKHLGIKTTAAHKKVSEGIQSVQARLRPAGDGKPRLFLLRDSLIEVDEELRDAARPTWSGEEVSSYVWDTSPNKPPKETPVKDNDHGMDAMRYMVATLEKGRSRDRSGMDLTSGLTGHR